MKVGTVQAKAGLTGVLPGSIKLIKLCLSNVASTNSVVLRLNPGLREEPSTSREQTGVSNVKSSQLVEALQTNPGLIVEPSSSREQAGICISNVETVKEAASNETIPALIDPAWDQKFEINWKFLPKTIAECLNEGRRLYPRDKREFVRFVSSAITDACSRPKRKNLVNIVQKIVNKFPKSLADTWCNETAGYGYESLLRKVVYRIENLNRNTNPNKLYKISSGGKQVSRLPVYKTYGCSNWQPVIIENEEDLQKKKNVMKTMYANGCRDVDAVVETLLKQTYNLQRRDINAGNDINTLIEDWPFLFTVDGLLGHFNELVGIDVRKKIDSALFVKGNSIVAFMSRIAERLPKKEKLRDTLFELLSSGAMPNDLVSDISGLLILIMEYFEEEKASLFVTVEVGIKYLCVYEFPDTI